MSLTIRFGDKEAQPRGELVINVETGFLTIGGVEVSPAQWKKLKKGVDAVLARKGFIKSTPAPTPVSSNFILANLPALNKIRRGRVRKAPFPLNLFFDAVVTKEELHGIN